ncbi:hypothetical protein [Chitinophaga sp. Cy-1792]|uniref:hypothetical protein n=1 Tax=Chitinophaga sp. Cy-1792 TaxID=2608339 RepID=UPI001423A7D5|nr:hypothetical protein [Chitinophaga sp. Cy-1792]NIG55012.1 hypothetical protein [Chitinophaga sp. Cy-1792]
MIADIRKTVNEIDHIIRKGLWLDFTVFKYEGRTLTIAGSEDLIYYHQLEIIFENVFFFRGYMDEWHSDTSAPVFVLPDDTTELNYQFEIEYGYTLFIFKAEDHKNDIIIAAESVSYNTDTVRYSWHENKKVIERIPAPKK